MQEKANPKWNVQQMGPVEYFKASTTTDKWLGTEAHDKQNEEQCKAGGISTTWYEAKQTRSSGEQPLRNRIVVGIDHWVIYDYCSCKETWIKTILEKKKQIELRNGSRCTLV